MIFKYKFFNYNFQLTYNNIFLKYYYINYQNFITFYWRWVSLFKITFRSVYISKYFIQIFKINFFKCFHFKYLYKLKQHKIKKIKFIKKKNFYF